MFITGLDIALQRINQIEQNFSSIQNTATAPEQKTAQLPNFETLLQDRLTNGTSFIRSTTNKSSLRGTANTHYDSKFSDLVRAASAKYGVDEDLINGVIKAESDLTLVLNLLSEPKVLCSLCLQRPSTLA
jgi:soluble lytic murein transglycosylase-like protein